MHVLPFRHIVILRITSTMVLVLTFRATSTLAQSHIQPHPQWLKCCTSTLAQRRSSILSHFHIGSKDINHSEPLPHWLKRGQALRATSTLAQRRSSIESHFHICSSANNESHLHIGSKEVKREASAQRATSTLAQVTHSNHAMLACIAHKAPMLCNAS